jgi:hypothetical protein
MCAAIPMFVLIQLYVYILSPQHLKNAFGFVASIRCFFWHCSFPVFPRFVPGREKCKVAQCQILSEQVDGPEASHVIKFDNFATKIL